MKGGNVSGGGNDSTKGGGLSGFVGEKHRERAALRSRTPGGGEKTLPS